MVTAYILLVALAAGLMAASCWIPALICFVIAMGLALRYEVRWLADHTRLTRHSKPRSVPAPTRHLRPTRYRG